MFEELNPGKLGTPQEMYQIVMLLCGNMLSSGLFPV